MTAKPKHLSAVSRDTESVESLYVELVRLFYEEGDREGADLIAARLDAVLAARPDVAESIRGEEIRSIIAELRGDMVQAIRSREAEIRKILELHSTTRHTPHWEFVSRRYDDGDVSDRLDLLAVLYDEHGDTPRAIATLRESKHYCEQHGIPFDGQDVLDELQAERGAKPRKGKASKRAAK